MKAAQSEVPRDSFEGATGAASSHKTEPGCCDPSGQGYCNPAKPGDCCLRKKFFGGNGPVICVCVGLLVMIAVVVIYSVLKPSTLESNAESEAWGRPG
jgi:hypothetical protein